MESRPSNAVLSGPLATGQASRHEIYRLFARLLDYPSVEFSSDSRELLLQLQDTNREAAELLGKFAEELQAMTAGRLQELYTSTFDMRPDRTLNLGCHIFGEDVRRNILMAELKKRMEARQISMGIELPDHLSLVLQLLACEDSGEEARALITDFLEPAVARLLSTFTGGEEAGPYVKAVRALLIVFRADPSVLAVAPS